MIHISITLRSYMIIIFTRDLTTFVRTLPCHAFPIGILTGYIREKRFENSAMIVACGCCV